MTARFDRSVRIASSSPATRVSSPSPQRRLSSQPRSHPRPRPRSPSPPVNEAEYLDPPPPYSQLSGRQGGGIGSDRQSSRKARGQEQDPLRPVYNNNDRRGAAAVATGPSLPPPSSWLTPGSRSTSTLFSPSQVREPREELPARDGEKKKATNSSSGGGTRDGTTRSLSGPGCCRRMRGDWREDLMLRIIVIALSAAVLNLTPMLVARL